MSKPVFVFCCTVLSCWLGYSSKWFDCDCNKQNIINYIVVVVVVVAVAVVYTYTAIFSLARVH